MTVEMLTSMLPDATQKLIGEGMLPVVREMLESHALLPLSQLEGWSAPHARVQIERARADLDNLALKLYIPLSVYFARASQVDANSCTGIAFGVVSGRDDPLPAHQGASDAARLKAAAQLSLSLGFQLINTLQVKLKHRRHDQRMLSLSWLARAQAVTSMVLRHAMTRGQYRFSMLSLLSARSKEVSAM
jgi:hypothetical protein